MAKGMNQAERRELRRATALLKAQNDGREVKPPNTKAEQEKRQHEKYLADKAAAKAERERVEAAHKRKAERLGRDPKKCCPPSMPVKASAPCVPSEADSYAQGLAQGRLERRLLEGAAFKPVGYAPGKAGKSEQFTPDSLPAKREGHNEYGFVRCDYQRGKQLSTNPDSAYVQGVKAGRTQHSTIQADPDKQGKLRGYLNKHGFTQHSESIHEPEHRVSAAETAAANKRLREGKFAPRSL